jgi:hypothetical protein
MEHEYTFDFAISYAGEDRPVAERIAKALTEGGAKVFYDHYYKSALLGRSLRKDLAIIYGPSTRFFLPFISKYYVDKDYTDYEWQIAKDEEKKRRATFILPIRLDDSKLVGLRGDVGFFDLRKKSKKSIESLVKGLLDKLGIREEIENVDWVATVGINVEELENGWPEIPRFPGPLGGYAELCDWLEEDLMQRLSKSGLQDWEIVEDSRNGETLSIRFRFHWVPSEEALDFGVLDWWEVLEVAPFKEIYPQR